MIEDDEKYEQPTITRINQNKVDDAICRFIGRHWKGFLMGFFTLAVWNMIMRWVTV